MNDSVTTAIVVVETRRVRGVGAFRLAFTRIEEKFGAASFTAEVRGMGGQDGQRQQQQ